MTNLNIKRKITAMLSAVMLISSISPAALAEATISEAGKDDRPLVELIVPVRKDLPQA